MSGSRFGPPVLFDARDGAGHVRLAIDHVALIHHDSRNGGDAQAPCVGNALVFGGDATLEVSAPWLSRRFTMAVACPGSAGSAAESSASIRGASSSSISCSPPMVLTG